MTNNQQEMINHIQIMQTFQSAAEGQFCEIRLFRGNEAKNIFFPVNSTHGKVKTLAKWSSSENDKGLNLFINVNSRLTESGGKKDVQTYTAAIIDVDTDKIGFDKAEAIAELKEISPIQPDLIVDSGGGLHVYYRIRPTSDYEALVDLQTTMQQTFKHLGADKSVVSDSSRVLRLAGSVNWKYDEDRGGRPTRIIEFTPRENVLSIGALSTLFDVGPVHTAVDKFSLPNSIPEGGTAEREGRNTLLFKEGSALRNRGYSIPEIEASLMELNRGRCVPPLLEAEITSIAKSSSRYTPTLSLFGADGGAADSDGKLFVGWEEMSTRHYEPPTYITYGQPRGSVGMIAGVADIGKSTLLRNIAVSLATGTDYLNIVQDTGPHRVMLGDWETPIAKYKSELDAMTSHLNEHQRTLLSENLTSFVAQDFGSRSMNLSDPKHFKQLEEAARDFKPDILIIDTVTAAFSLKSENDNGEVTNHVMKPLQRLATDLNCVVLIAHHIGKAYTEEGSQSSPLYRARGASAFVGMSFAVLNLDTKKSTTGERVVSIEYVKVKDAKPKALVVRFDVDSHWFETDADTTAFDQSDENYVRFTGLVTGIMTTAEIVTVSKKRLGIGRSTVEKYLKKAVLEQLLEHADRGQYAPVSDIPFHANDGVEIAPSFIN